LTELTRKTLENGESLLLSDKPVAFGCDKCKGGYIYFPKEEGLGYTYEYCTCYIEAELLKERREAFQNSNLEGGLIGRYKLVDWQENKSLPFDELVKMIDSSEDDSKWLFLYGGAGTGKTYTAIILAWIALFRDKTAYFSDVVSLLDELRPSNDEAYLVIKKCREVDVLILDDIGHEKSSQWVRERLYLIINSRWNNQKMTIFTSNFPIENLKRTVSGAVYSRVKGESLEVHLADKDKRIIK